MHYEVERSVLRELAKKLRLWRKEMQTCKPEERDDCPAAEKQDCPKKGKCSAGFKNFATALTARNKKSKEKQVMISVTNLKRDMVTLLQ